MLIFDSAEFDRRFNALLDILAMQPSPDLVEAVGAEVVQQTRDRIKDEKRAPDGTQWPPWSPAYAATRGAQHSLLVDTGDLFESIRPIQRGRGKTVRVGSRLVYARKQDTSREFIGMSSDNEEAVLFVIGRFLEQELARA